MRVAKPDPARDAAELELAEWLDIDPEELQVKCELERCAPITFSIGRSVAGSYSEPQYKAPINLEPKMP